MLADKRETLRLVTRCCILALDEDLEPREVRVEHMEKPSRGVLYVSNNVLAIAPVAFSQEREMLLICVEDAQILKLLQRDLHDLSVDIESSVTSSTLTTVSSASLRVRGSYTFQPSCCNFGK